MSDWAVHVEGLWKQFRIQQGARPSYLTLRDQIAEAVNAPLQRMMERGGNSNGGASRGQRYIWALRDVSLDIPQGEAVGIIGPNGAGKSTLLKILTRITEPTRGSLDICGRVGSLLEVGTGFHKELTGRENVYLNGAILGMKKKEIDRKFDQIVEFSEVSKFIDTPVKFYSSGMQVRLAFSVAAHLEPEILLVDEVLAVGDAAFQKKCLSKMEDVGKEGRTVVFVSHHMPSVTRLCERAVLLDKGSIIRSGPATEVVGEYLTTSLGTTCTKTWAEASSAPGDETIRLRAVRATNADRVPTYTLDIRQPVGVEIEFDVLRPGVVFYPGFSIFNEEGVRLFYSLDSDPAWRGQPYPVGRYLCTAWIPGNFLAEGTFLVQVLVRSEEPRYIYINERDAVGFHIVEGPEGGETARMGVSGKLPGAIRPMLRWETVHHPREYSSVSWTVTSRS